MKDTLLEKLAKDYANEANGNSIDEFTPTQKLLMMTTYKHGFKKARELMSNKMAQFAEDSCSCTQTDTFLWLEQEMLLIGEEEIKNE
jgi:hypothetical protein